MGSKINTGFITDNMFYLTLFWIGDTHIFIETANTSVCESRTQHVFKEPNPSSSVLEISGDMNEYEFTAFPSIKRHKKSFAEE